MRRQVIAGCVAVGALLATTAGAQELSARRLDLHFHDDGRVSLGAQNVSAREILLEWRRQCGCEVVNAEEVPGGAIMLPMQFDNAEQRVVLQSLLRQAAGYVLTPKPAGSSAPSDYGTIYILARSTASEGTYMPPPVPTPSVQPPTSGFPDDEIPPIGPLTDDAASEPAVQTQPAEAPPPNTSPFGSRTYSPFTTTPRQGTVPGMTPTAPGRTAPPSPGTTPQPQEQVAPAPSRPFQRGTAVPIVAVPPDER